ncbi:TPA: tail fiber assembly protein [Salmonella enterica subsp. enterica serovar Kiambu]|uniref:Phage tail protein n=1 Tax=Salmonella enterica subsp. enterica serovar Give TaxID=46626 RepID=A0A6X8REW3_SALET|nr:phage tail protein [Salmonella enterica subsp. enterica serovar Agona]EDR8458069.1 tail fiber assembly protein [Salmonella enterica]EEE3306351.1 tail fiber assembly protein [Salmonella enterica subsp. enterica]EGR7103403.1 tail fiber assembly protein [Salmonella enterica subsp. enterica serovar Enteritidis]ESB60687.1 putative tail fiber assembly [Salmonella enterica subsp. enterica serovar Agona str. 266757-1]HAB2179164.1 phage tail protein [Salmonella enterica subsp. enterica serovar Give]
MTGNYSYIYDASTNAFYALALMSEYKKSGIWPDNGVRVTSEQHRRLMAGQSEGNVISADAEGNPVLTPALIDYVAIAADERDKLMASATARINQLVEAQDDDDITAAELSELIALREYRTKLRRLDLRYAPNVEWPPLPE